jgi:single-stranded-DNA-specific exonuclease
VVVGDMSWGPGILGLIAQKIIDETGKPVFVWGQGDDKTSVKGSCRSKGDVHVVEMMAYVGHELLSHFGGHEQAGGFSLLVENISKLSDALNEAYEHVEVKNLGNQKVVADTTLSLDDINEVTYKAIEVLAPFGVGNPKPIFEFMKVVPLAVKWFGKKNEHFEVIYSTSKGGKVKAIQFFASKDMEAKASKEHTILASLEKSYFAGKTELRLRIVAIT